jgi:hypothetical protein
MIIWQPALENIFYGKNATECKSREELKLFSREAMNQIHFHVHMACALNFRKDLRTGESNLNPFVAMSVRKPKGRVGNWQFYILLDRASDSYVVSLIRYKNEIGGEFYLDEKHSGVYCDQLSSLIYEICNP